MRRPAPELFAGRWVREVGRWLRLSEGVGDGLVEGEVDAAAVLGVEAGLAEAVPGGGFVPLVVVSPLAGAERGSAHVAPVPGGGAEQPRRPDVVVVGGRGPGQELDRRSGALRVVQGSGVPARS
jgi:hypothetical protein